MLFVVYCDKVAISIMCTRGIIHDNCVPCTLHEACKTVVGTVALNNLGLYLTRLR